MGRRVITIRERNVKVFTVIDSFSFGGAERLLATLARAAPGAGLELEVASLAPFSTERTGMLGVLRGAGLAPRFLSIPRLAHARAIPTLVRAIRASGCEVVHAHLGYSATLVPPAARLARRYAVCTFHEVPVPLPRKEAVKERLAVSMATRSRACIFVSRASMDGFAARYPPNPATWTVLHNGIDLAEFKPRPAPLPADLDVPPGAPVVALVAAMRRSKGHRHAVSAWPSVLREIPDARLALVGSGPEEPSLRAQVAALRLGNRVTFVGVRTDVAQMMRAAALVILPSQTEALPTTLIEAAACGKAVVATRVGGVGEVVREGETGLLVAPDDPPELAAAIVELLRDDARRTRMGEAARQVAERDFDMHGWARRLRAVYERAAEGAPVNGRE